MTATLPPDRSRPTFQELLHGAIIGGQTPPEMSGLGPDTVAAIDAVARHHPEASADHIAEAYDAFLREHA